MGLAKIGHSLFAIAYLLLFKNAKGLISMVWAILFLSGLLVVIAMSLTVGAYFPALDVVEIQPTVFFSISGGIRTLYRSGLAGSLLLLIIFCKETFWRNGLINRNHGVIILGILTLSVALGLSTSLPIKVMGASWFFLPLFLGYSYLKKYK